MGGSEATLTVSPPIETAAATMAPAPDITTSAPDPGVAVVEPSPSWPDEAAESAMVSELRARGEVVAPPPSTEPIEETESTPLPPLDELVNKIPAEVRETLEDLFRARFVTVKRLPRKALK